MAGDARRGRLRADEPLRSLGGAARISCRCPSTRCSATRPVSARSSPARRAGDAPPPLVRGRDHHRGIGAGRGLAPPGGGSRRIRGRHGRLSRPARRVEIGLDHLSSIGIDAIHDRVMALTGWLLARLASATHSNGAPLARVFGPAGLTRRGATVAFHLMAPDGTPYDVRAIEDRANAARISLRTGCFCNPGDGEVAHGISRMRWPSASPARRSR